MWAMLRSSRELDLRDQAAVRAFFEAGRPDDVFLAAARVGGILANDTSPADFLYDNLAVEANVIHAVWRGGVRKLPFLGSTCIYPKLAPQPLKEEYLLTGPLEPTNEWYAVAKIAGIKTIAPGKALHPVGGPPRADQGTSDQAFDIVVASEAKQSRLGRARRKPWIATAPCGRLAMTVSRQRRCRRPRGHGPWAVSACRNRKLAMTVSRRRGWQ